MNEMTIRLERNGAAAVPGGQLLLGYAGNRGNYRLRIEQRGEWKGLTVCAHWHTPGASAATLVENGILTVPAAVTAVPGAGCLTFEGTDGSQLEGIAVLSECIHPECLGMDHAGGNWAKSLPPRSRNSTGVHYGALLDYEMKNLDVMDGAMENSPKLRVSRIT